MSILKLELIELTNKQEFGNTYDIYKYCMFMPTKEKFQKKTVQFATDDSIKIFACFHQGKVAGIIVVSFTGQHKIEIVGIAVDVPFRNKGIGSYMINCLIDDYSVKSIFAETDKDAVEFYKKNSFEIEEFAENYDGETIIRYKCKRTQ